MHLLFFAFVLCAIAAIPIHFISVEHVRLQQKYGKDRAIKIGETCGRLSGYMLFLSLIGLWFSPQPRFTVPVLRRAFLQAPGINVSMPLIHIILFVLLTLPGVLFLSRSVSGLTRRVSEAHRPEKVVVAGVYSRVRHPQYFGFILMHVGFSFLLSGLFALLSTPLIFLMLYCFARKEELELMKDFGRAYDEYRKKVPMLIPRLRR